MRALSDFYGTTMPVGPTCIAAFNYQEQHKEQAA